MRFQPKDSRINTIIDENNSMYASGVGWVTMSAPINFPAKVKIRRVSLRVWDNSPADMSVRLVRLSFDGKNEILGETTSSGRLNDWQNLKIKKPLVVNSKYCYLLEVKVLAQAGQDMKIGSTFVGYTRKGY